MLTPLQIKVIEEISRNGQNINVHRFNLEEKISNQKSLSKLYDSTQSKKAQNTNNFNIRSHCIESNHFDKGTLLGACSPIIKKNLRTQREQTHKATLPAIKQGSLERIHCGGSGTRPIQTVLQKDKITHYYKKSIPKVDMIFNSHNQTTDKQSTQLNTIEEYFNQYQNEYQNEYGQEEVKKQYLELQKSKIRGNKEGARTCERIRDQEQLTTPKLIQNKEIVYMVQRNKKILMKNKKSFSRQFYDQKDSEMREFAQSLLQYENNTSKNNTNHLTKSQVGVRTQQNLIELSPQKDPSILSTNRMNQNSQRLIKNGARIMTEPSMQDTYDSSIDENLHSQSRILGIERSSVSGNNNELSRLQKLMHIRKLKDVVTKRNMNQRKRYEQKVNDMNQFLDQSRRSKPSLTPDQQQLTLGEDQVRQIKIPIIKAKKDSRNVAKLTQRAPKNSEQDLPQVDKSHDKSLDTFRYYQIYQFPPRISANVSFPKRNKYHYMHNNNHKKEYGAVRQGRAKYIQAQNKKISSKFSQEKLNETPLQKKSSKNKYEEEFDYENYLNKELRIRENDFDKWGVEEEIAINNQADSLMSSAENFYNANTLKLK